MRPLSYWLVAIVITALAIFTDHLAFGELWWERGADKWYYKDDWRGQGISGSRRDNRAGAVLKTIEVRGGAASGWIVIWGDHSYELAINDKAVGSSVDGGLIDDYDLTRFVTGDPTTVKIRIEGDLVCAEGEIVGRDGKRYAFATGADWQDENGKKVSVKKMAVQASSGAYNRAHNGRLMTYNDEERGKTAIAKALARIQKFDEQGVYLMRRYRPAEQIISFDPDLPWRRAERIAAPLLEQARSILASRAIPSQKQGRFTDSIGAAGEAAALISAAEAPVSVATDMYLADRQRQHLANWSAILGNQGPPLGEDLAELARLSAAAQRAHALGDWATAAIAVRRMSDLNPQICGRLHDSAVKAFGSIPGGIGHLDEFPEDRFAWFNAHSLMGNDPARWPFVAAPSSVACIDLCGMWNFRVDPNNEGERQGWNLTVAGEGWRKLFAPDAWERQGILEENEKAPGAPLGRGGRTGEDKPYNGFAWYHKKVFVPRDWQGQRVILASGNIQNWSRVFINGKPVADMQAETEARRLIPGARQQIPQELIKFGQDNTIAIQVYNQENFGGIVGGPLALYIEGEQPAVRHTTGPMSHVFENAYTANGTTTRYTLLASAMSPGVVVATDGPAIELWGWAARGYAAPDSITFVTSSGPRTIGLDNPAEILSSADLAENWLLLRGKETNALIVPSVKPASVSWLKNAQGAMELRIASGGSASSAIILCLPPDAPSDDKSCRTWEMALRNYPVSATECVSVAAGAASLQTNIIRYNYLKLSPEKSPPAAPVPMLASFGVQYKFPSLATPQARSTDYHSGYATYELVDGTDTLSYQSPVLDRSKMMKGDGELFARKVVSENVHGGLGEIDMFKRMVGWGMDHCRYALAFDAEWDLPMVGNHTKITDDPVIWSRLDELIKNCNDSGMQMMLCWFPEIRSRNWKQHPEWQAATFEWWRRVAQRYADLPDWAISYDFFNEPAYMTIDHWNAIMRDLTAIVRSVDKKHTIVWEAADGWAQPFWCMWMQPVKDDNVLYSFHHYGKHWGYAYDEYYPGYQATPERTQIDPWLEAILFGIKNNVPIHCGEFGLSMIQPDGDGEKWLDDYLGMFERFGIGWNWWNYSGGDIYRTGMAAGDRISPYVPILSKWAARSGWGASRRAAGLMPPMQPVTGVEGDGR